MSTPMQDERGVVSMIANRERIDVLTVSTILDILTKGGRERGYTLHRTFRRRYNDDGDQIGPEARMASDQIRHLERAVELVAEALDKAVDEMVTSGQGKR